MDSGPLTPLLIDAKREYVGQLSDVLAPFVLNHFVNVYVAVQKLDKASPTLTFQRALREIPAWNSVAVAQKTAEVQNRYKFLGDLIAACFVAYVKVLSSVKLHQHKPNIRLRLPSNETFVHKVYVHAAREFYNAPALLNADRAAKLGVVRAAVEASVRDMLPIEDILKAYLGNTVDAADNTMNPDEFDREEDNAPEGFDDFGGLGVDQPPAFPPPQPQQQPNPFAAAPPPAFAPPQQPQQPDPFAAPLPQQPAFAAPSPQQPDPFAAPAFPSQQPDTFPSQQQGMAQLPQHSVDDAPKQISIGPSRFAPPPQQGVMQRPDLFSDAEDDF